MDQIATAAIHAFVWINGEPRCHRADEPLIELLAREEIRPDAPYVAVAVNGQLVRRAEWPDRLITAGDHIDIVHAVRGG